MEEEEEEEEMEEKKQQQESTITSTTSSTQSCGSTIFPQVKVTDCRNQSSHRTAKCSSEPFPP